MEASILPQIKALEPHQNGPIRFATNKKIGSKSKYFAVSAGQDKKMVYYWMDESNQLKFDEKSVDAKLDGSIGWYDDLLYAGQTHDNLGELENKFHLNCLSFPNALKLSGLRNFIYEVACLDCSNDGKFVVAGSTDFTVFSIELENGKQVGHNRHDIDEVPECIRIDPTNKYFALAFHNSTISIYNLKSDVDDLGMEDSSTVATIDITKKSFLGKGDVSYAMTWSNNGDTLFVPTQGCVKIISSGGWCQAGLLLAGNATSDFFNLSCLSPCGEQLVASTITGMIFVFGIEKRECLRFFENPTVQLTSIIWNPFGEKQLVVADKENKVYSFSIETTNAFPRQSEPKKTKRIMIEEDSDTEQMDTIDSKSAVSEDFGFDDENTNMSADLGKIKEKYGFDKSSGEFVSKSSNKVEETIVKYEKYRPPALPKPFGICSTPRAHDGCFLKWNKVGTVKKFCTDDGEDYLEFNFHDISIHAEITVQENGNKWSMADISNSAIAYASSGSPKSSSKLIVNYFASWDYSSRNWECHMLEDENIVGLCIGDDFIAVATSSRIIRIFSLAGTQLDMFGYSGPFLTMICSGNNLLVVTIVGGPIQDEDNYEFAHKINWYFIGNKKNKTLSIPLELSAWSTLRYLSFTEDNQLISMDSNFVFRVLQNATLNWLPILNGKELIVGCGDSIWPTTIAGDTHLIRYIYVRNYKYPSVSSNTNNPLSAKWKLPILDGDTEKSQFESELMFNQMFKHLTATGKITNILKLFAVACTSNRLVRATDATKMCETGKHISTLCNYAAKEKINLLVEKVSEIGRNMDQKVTNCKSVFGDDLNLSEIAPSKPRISFQDKTPIIVKVPKRVFPKSPHVPIQPVVAAMQDLSSNDYGDSSSFTTNYSEPPKGEIKQSASMDVLSIDTCQSESGVSSSFNPFKKTSQNNLSSLKISEDLSNVNYFDELGTPTESASTTFGNDNSRKRPLIDATQGIPSQKQAKLSFGGKPSGYDLWKKAVHDGLVEQYNGDKTESAFERYTGHKFKQLPPGERKKWADKANT
uniref:Mcl1_mid domain-containing protein n=1 Tax=Rhabditophanes sp. KR3021 TaxID=114890 RepID=A0AC35TNM1_9BILA